MQKEEKSQTNKRSNKNQGQRKQETNNNKEDKVDSITVAYQLIEGSQETISRWLLQLRKLKNPNYQKFQDKVLDNLAHCQASLDSSIKRFIAISQSANEQNTTGNQMTHIFKGFTRYWRTLQFSFQVFEQLFKHYYQLYYPLCKTVANYWRETIQKKFDDKFQHFQKLALQMTHYFMKSNRKSDQKKALALIYEFNLYNEISSERIVDIIIQEQNIKEVMYVFTDHEDNLRKKLFNSFVNRCLKLNDKNETVKCQKAIKELNLNPQDYPNFISKLHQNYIRYQLRTFKLFQIELSINHDLRLIHVLIQELKCSRRRREMSYFIIKYELQKQYNYHFDQKESVQLRRIKNVLLQCDEFGPTERDVLQQQQHQMPYLYLKDFGITQNQVVFVDNDNIKEINIKQQFAQLKVGIDSERAGGVHVFDPSKTQIVQIFTGKRVLIFDYLNLKTHELFKEIFTYLFTHCTFFGQGIKKEMSQLKEDLNLDIQEKLMQELMKDRIFSVDKEFKEAYPKEKKFNLSYICEVVFAKKLSKYEQCSGWKNRPLRRAQLHYAALDCVAPYKIYEKLQKVKK